MSRLFLIDANLPVALARALDAAGYKSLHVTDLSSSSTLDRGIWQLAEQANYAIFSRDRDFAEFVHASADGPAVVWLRMGNARKRRLITRVSALMPQIVASLDSGERLVEVR